MRVDALAVAHQLRELLPHRLQLVEAGLLRVPQRRADHHVGRVHQPQHVGEGGVAVQRAADELGGAGVAVEEHVLPRNQHVVEHDQRLHLVEPVGERVVLHAPAPGEARAADVLDPGRPHLDDAADRVVRQLVVRPGAEGGLQERLVGIGGGRLVLGAADDDAGVGLPRDAHHHVGILVLRRQRPVALRVGVGGDVEQVAVAHGGDVAVDVVGEARVDLGQHVATVLQRPHLAHRLVADAGDDAADVLQHGVHGGKLVRPVLRLRGRAVEDRLAPVVLDVGQRVLVRRLERHVVHAGAHVDDRLQRRVRRHVAHALALDPHLAAVPQPLAIGVTRADHRITPVASHQLACRARIIQIVLSSRSDQLFRSWH